MLPHGMLTTFQDEPLFEPYVRAVVRSGARVVVRSKWLNAVSAVLPDGGSGIIRKLPFVDRVERVGRVRTGYRDAEKNFSSDSPPPTQGPVAISGYDYGPSFAQLDAMGVPELHAIGITGRDVIIGFLDSGFRWRSHGSLDGAAVLGEFDFVNNDNVTGNQDGDPAGQDFHGTVVLSVTAGFHPGRLIGAAFGSSYLLAKTEVVPTETQVEEDYWAAGMEWLEAGGADVVNSSVGYDVWDNGSGYSRDVDFDGRTSIVARTAAIAARLGVVVCASMGNEGNGDGVTGTLLTPADVDTLVSVGAVSIDGFLSGSSSTGPTSDGRIKPDVCAPGVSVYAASTAGYASYTSQGGTSMASPLAAGAAALLLSARPELTPAAVRDILRSSADTTRIRGYSSFPNNFAGWGYLDAFTALLSVGPFFSNRPVVDTTGLFTDVSVNVVSKYGIVEDSVILHYGRAGTTESMVLPMTLDSSFLFPGSGRYSVSVPPHAQGTLIRFTITTVDSSGRRYSSPPEGTRNGWLLGYGMPGLADPLPGALRLLQNYPNPVISETNILFDLPADGHVTVTLYDMLGRRVRTLFDGYMAGGTAESRAPLKVRLSGLPSGAYLCRLTGPGGTDMNKMMILR